MLTGIYSFLGASWMLLLDAPDVVDMAEKVSRSTLKKRSSIQVALEHVRDGKAQAFFSAGNTAACWAIARMVLGTLEEVAGYYRALGQEELTVGHPVGGSEPLVGLHPPVELGVGRDEAADLR